jgi:hypothetical protein
MWFVNGVAGGNPTFGTIDGSQGLIAKYLAPANLPNPASFFVQALSLADFTTYASALVTVVAPVSINISPLTIGVAAGGSQQFTATVTNVPVGSDPGVSWSVNGVIGGDATVGTVTPAGLYSAPATAPSPSAVKVAATSNSNSSKVASATVTITASLVGVALSPGAISLRAGTTQQFAAYVQGSANKAVTWKVNGTTGGSATSGTISTTGLYTAPASVPTPANVTVSAVASADATKLATTAVTVTAPQVSVAVAPATLAIRTTQTQQFAASVTGSTNTAVTWKVNGTNGGSATFGTISTSGLYTAPAVLPSPSTVTILAVPAADISKSGAATANITTATTILVSVNPASAVVAPAATQAFVATVQNSTTKTVTWKVNGVTGGNATVGTISTAGSYKAPATVPTPAAVTVTAVSTVDTTKSGVASATIAKLVTVTVAPTTASVQAGGTKQFTATVLNSANAAVTWSVNGIPGGDAVVGSISAAGLYQAPQGVPTPVTVSVSAASVASPTASAKSTVTITGAAIKVSVSPASISVMVGKTQQFAVAVQNATNAAITWKVNGTTGGSASLGTISAAGLYTAPAAVPSTATVTISAVSVADTTKSGSAAATVQPAPALTVLVTPAHAKLVLGQVLQFGASVLNSTNPAVTWNVNGVTGGDAANGTIDTIGRYSAPLAMPSAPVVVSATSQANPASSGSASVSLLSSTPVSVSISPSWTYATLGGSLFFVASVQNSSDTTVTWLVNGIPGGSETVGFIMNGLYEAPRTAPGESITLTAISNADDTKSATAKLSIVQSQVSAVYMGPPNPTVPVGQWFKFTAAIDAAPGLTTTILWDVNGRWGGDELHGTIDDTGFYTAPLTVPADPVVVSAFAAAAPDMRASTTVTIANAPPVVLTPSSATVQVGTTIRFTPTVTLPVKTLTWKVNGVVGGSATVGTIDADGLYAAPLTVPTPPTVTIIATSTSDSSKSATATATIVTTPPIAIYGPLPPTTIIQVGTTQQLNAPVENAVDTSVKWLVNGIIGGNNTVGTISAAGLFLAPGRVPTPSTVTVTAVSNSDPSKSVSGTITIFPVPPPLVYVRNWQGVLLQPCGPFWIQAGTNTQFYGSIKNDMTGRLLWQVNGVTGGDATNGLIDAQGVYSAPPSVPAIAEVVISAALQSNPYVVFPINATIGP